jgi:hypothetical protein
MYLDLRCNIDAIAMIIIFCTVVLSTDAGNGTDTQEFYPLIRQGTTKWYQSIVLPIGLRS